jgi:hypothetical protein
MSPAKRKLGTSQQQTQNNSQNDLLLRAALIANTLSTNNATSLNDFSQMILNSASNSAVNSNNPSRNSTVANSENNSEFGDEFDTDSSLDEENKAKKSKPSKLVQVRKHFTFIKKKPQGGDIYKCCLCKNVIKIILYDKLLSIVV